MLGGNIPVECSLPNSHTSQRAVIRQVPTGDTNEEIRTTLIEEGYKVTKVYRFFIDKGTAKIPSITVSLEFDGPIPKEIFLSGLKFTTGWQLPSPLRCKKCQKLGHTERFCNTPYVCPNCGGCHKDINNCTLPSRCVNCNGRHPSSSSSCPKFLQMRTFARTAAEKGTHFKKSAIRHTVKPLSITYLRR